MPRSLLRGFFTLIDEISNATNKQTPVFNADKFANEIVHIEMQNRVFERYGLLYERKRGEFSDGVRDGYVAKNSIIERNHFWRLLYSVNGKINRGFEKKLFQKNEFADIMPVTDQSLDRLFLGVKVFEHLRRGMKPDLPILKDIYGKVFSYMELFKMEGFTTAGDTIDNNIEKLQEKWKEFLNVQSKKPGPGRQSYIDKDSGQAKSHFNLKLYFRSRFFERDLLSYFAQQD